MPPTASAAALPPPAVTVAPYAGEREEWDGFVRRTPGGTIFHSIAWKQVIERSFAFESAYLVARRGGAVVGVLPLFAVRAAWMPHGLLSVPFGVDGGVCAADAAAQGALDAAAVALCEARGAQYVELRDGHTGPAFTPRAGVYYRFRRPLAADDAVNFASLPSKRRYMIRLAQRHQLTAHVDPGADGVFYHLYAHTARRFGTPVFPRRFFRTVLDALADDATLLIVSRSGAPLAAALLMFFGDTVSPYYVGSRREDFRYAPNDFLYWEAMRYGWRRGARQFDFGRSKSATGAFEFKRLWGFHPEPMQYRVFAPDAVPQQRSTNDRHLRWLQRGWRRLPLRITQLLGPPLVRRLGPYYT